MANLGHGAVGIIGRYFNEDGRTAGPVTLVGQLLIDAAFKLAGALLDRSVDVVVRHVHRFGGIDGGAKARVAARVAAAALSGYGDLTNDLGPRGCSARVGDSLLALDLLPFAVSGHGRTPSR